jgi:cytochrome c oxidase subunit II
MRHFVIVGVLTAVLTALVYLILSNVGLLPVQASAQALPIDRMINLQIALISFLFSLIIAFMGYSIVVFRQRQGDTTDGVHMTGSTRLEVLWTLLPLALVIYLSFIGAQALGEVRQPEAQALQVKVTAFQWSWLFEYPEYGIRSNTLYLPVDRQAQLLLTSRDVIHSFWVPEFRVKQDALPGENLVKEVRITPTILGEYKVLCAEMCGGAHAYMVSPVKVVSQEEFQAWLDEQSKTATADPAQRGERLAQTNCVSCHSLDGTKLVGPTWKGLYNSEVKLADGSTVTADDAYLLESIVDPHAKVHQGFPQGVMPATYDTLLTEQQISDIVEFMKTVK